MRITLTIEVFFAALATATACSSESTSSSSAAASADGGSERGPDGASNPTLDAGALTASGYCERIAIPFCAFYMRCGRIVAADETECRATFLETCNARYERRYVDLESAGLLALSASGIDACASHLANVSCDEQKSDLDGPCSRMWSGSSPVGAPCGVDVESFVCASGTTCVLGLDLCGKCETAAERGGSCGSGVRCVSGDECVEGICKERVRTFVTVGEGETCDSDHRCAYRSACESGKCVKTSLLGEPCTTDRSCASGRCESGTCVPLRADGERCKGAGECASALCSGGTCHALPSACFSR